MNTAALEIELMTLPTQDNLPSDDGEPMETERHIKQMDLLIKTLEPWLATRQDGYVGGNMFVYYSAQQWRHQDFKGPDVFVALEVPPGERKSWVSWQEGKTPDVVIELLSDSTAKYDKTKKKHLYQTQLKVAEYFWYDPFNSDDFKGFQLVGGVYQELPLEAQQYLVSHQLGLTLIRWLGTYRGVETTWLRWATLAGELLLLPEETQLQRANAEAQRADTEAQRANVEAQRANVEAQRAHQEAQARQQAEAEIARLTALLAERS